MWLHLTRVFKTCYYTDIVGAPSEIAVQNPKSEFHLAVIRQFVEHIRSGNWSLYAGSEGLRRARINDACYTSAQQGREVVPAASPEGE
jgi:predicted dehydrogenase